MKYGKLALGALLAGIWLCPAQAAVTDVEGGDVQQVYNFRTTIKADGHITIGGKDFYYEGGQDVTLHGDISDPAVQRRIMKEWSNLFNWAVATRQDLVAEGETTEMIDKLKVTNHTTGQLSRGRHVRDSGGSFFGNGTDSVSAYGGGMDFQMHSTTKSGAEAAGKVEGSVGSILVGDVDNLATAYAAQGTFTQEIHKYEVYQINLDGIISPIVLDLDGDDKIQASNGLHLPHPTSFDKESAVFFDFHGNGFAVVTEWVGPQDGLLCRPEMGKNIDGTHLFGIANGFNNGYEELASLDSDGSGALEGAELKGLFVWQDLNRNGVNEPNELKSLDELGITSIGVTHRNMVGSYTRNGKTHRTFDWWPTIRDVRKMNINNL